MLHERLPLPRVSKPIRNTIMRAILLCLAGTLLPGCVLVSIQKPPPGTRFRDIAKPSDIAAVYNNFGKGKGGVGESLYDALFPDPLYTCSDRPDQIRFQSRNHEVIRCESILGGKVVKVRDLVQNRDFRISGGAVHIIFRKDNALATDMEAGVVGVEKESATLRLTDTGDIVLTQSTISAAMVMFVVPAGGVGSVVSVFKRVSDG